MILSKSVLHDNLIHRDGEQNIPESFIVTIKGVCLGLEMHGLMTKISNEDLGALGSFPVLPPAGL